MDSAKAELFLSPQGHLHLDTTLQAQEMLPSAIFKRIEALFAKDCHLGLLHLGIEDFSCAFPPSFSFWQGFARQFVAEVCKLPVYSLSSMPCPPSADSWQLLLNQAFGLTGAEHLNYSVLLSLWENLHAALYKALENRDLQEYLKLYNARWNLVGRVYFHLAENKNSTDHPFAFLATYTTHLSQQAAAQHLPLQKALQEYAGEKNHAALLALLLPVQKAADKSPFIKYLLDKGQLFAPQLWTAQQALNFLRQISLLEECGILVRVPNWWSAQRTARPKVSVTLGEHQKGKFGLNTLLDFDVNLTLGDGESLSQAEWQRIMDSPDGLLKVKDRWIEVDKEKLSQVLAHWKELQAQARDGIPLSAALRLVAGKGLDVLATESSAENTCAWSTIVAGDWLQKLLQQLKDPVSTAAEEKILQNKLQGTLRPYQKKGVNWLWLLYRLKLGGCLADDMGLGKTIQVLALLLLIQAHVPGKTHLLIVPASLIGNWQLESQRFAPTLKIKVLHSTYGEQKASGGSTKAYLQDTDVVMTTYGSAQRLAWLKEVEWDLIILDEAQQIKNPSAKQTQAIKGLKAATRLTLTGTPVENRLSDLWSLFDFTSAGLLGSNKAFAAHAKQAAKQPEQYAHFMSTLKKLTQPYILRRLKSDKSIIADLPDKAEVQTFCTLSKEQMHLYQQSVNELAEKLKSNTGMERKGLILAYILRFKQICNHPAQWLGYGAYDACESGKFLRLKEICQQIAAKQEKVLIFTQFKEIIPFLADFLAHIFGRAGLILHGSTPVKQRSALVAEFQAEFGPPFFVLSLKAGGTGLTLTRAAHVIHFDRWWNPAVENQATDRAYRIGQKRSVLVHKFICRGTIEEHIDALISSKKALAEDVLQSGGELSLTELSDQEILKIVSLDINAALEPS